MTAAACLFRHTARAMTFCLAVMAAIPLSGGAAEARIISQDQLLDATIRPGWKTERGRMAALQLNLAPGWKTYWRSPGDAGIPPQFDWSGSRNVKAVNLIWPRPSVFHSNGMRTIGYHDRLVLPIEVIAVDPAQPILLDAEIEIGICKEICVPASLHIAANLSGNGAPDGVIRAALDSRPVPGRSAGLSRVSCQVEPISDGLRLTARMNLPAARTGREEVVAVELQDRGVWVSEVHTTREGPELTAVAELVPPGRGAFALERSGITLTVIRHGEAVEIRGCPGP